MNQTVEFHTVTMPLREMLDDYLKIVDYCFLCPIVNRKFYHQDGSTWDGVDNIHTNCLEVFCREFPDVCQISGCYVHLDPDVQKELLNGMFLESVLIEQPKITTSAYDRSRKLRIAVLEKLIELYGGDYTMNFLVKIWRAENV